MDTHLYLDSPHRCCFCYGTALRPILRRAFHPRLKTHGPFDFYQCIECGSGLTLPLPSAAALAGLYGSFHDGLPADLRQMRGQNALEAWYRQSMHRGCVFAGKNPTDAFTWLDIGAGAGELARLVSLAYPRATGLAADMHDRPAALAGCGNVDWRVIDANRPVFGSDIGEQADVVFAISVLEHVQFPDTFLDNLVRRVKPGGALYLACPNYGSVARRVLRTRWPYFIPGEHLNMPTRRGVRAAITRSVRSSSNAGLAKVFGDPITLPYTAHYFLRFYRLGFLTRLVPSSLTLPLPGGALEAGFRTG